MKRYLIFAGSSYYPDGGALDFKGTASSLRTAIKLAEKVAQEDNAWGYWWHVFDTTAGKIVAYCPGEGPSSVTEWHKEKLVHPNAKVIKAPPEGGQPEPTRED